MFSATAEQGIKKIIVATNKRVLFELFIAFPSIFLIVFTFVFFAAADFISTPPQTIFNKTISSSFAGRTLCAQPAHTSLWEGNWIQANGVILRSARAFHHPPTRFSHP
jgi:hypothetical protein